jgi:hypothetical protein
MSPSQQIVNPLGQSGEQPDYGDEFIYVQFNPAGSGVILSGNVVEVAAAVTGDPPTILLCQLTSATGNFEFLGVAVDAPAGGYVPGQVVKIKTAGVAEVLFDDAGNTTFGHLAIQSATVAGQALDSAAATLAKTLGVILETVTVTAAGTPVAVLLRIM